MKPARACSECGAPLTGVLLHPRRNGRGKPGRHAVPGHDLCRRCFRALMSRAAAGQQAERVRLHLLRLDDGPAG